MAEYKLTRNPDCEGKLQYEIMCMDEFDDRLISWDYNRLDEIAMRLKVGEEYIINV